MHLSTSPHRTEILHAANFKALKFGGGESALLARTQDFPEVSCWPTRSYLIGHLRKSLKMEMWA
jgi:hypothetical protein